MTLLLQRYDFRAAFLFNPYEPCGVEWLARARRLERPVSVGMDIPNCCRPQEEDRREQRREGPE